MALGERLARYADDLETLRDVLDGKVDVTGVSDDSLRKAVTAALAPPPDPRGTGGRSSASGIRSTSSSRNGGIC